MNNLSFNGITKDYVTVLEKKRPVFAPIRRNFLTMPGMLGAYLESTDTEVRIQTVAISVENNDFTSFQKLKEDLAAWLITEKEAPLIFEDESDRTYFAVVDGSLDLEEIVTFGQGTITFICPDPYKYGPEKEVSFTNVAQFNIEGSVETEPIIEVTLCYDTTYVAVSNGEKLNMVGNPAKQDETPTEWQTPLLMSTCDSLVGWTASSAESSGQYPNIGQLLTDGDYFYASDYGSYLTDWHGPAMKKSLPEALQDFRFDIGFHMNKTGLNQAGAIEVSLLDANNALLATLKMTKHFGGLDTLYSRVIAKNYDVVNESQAQFNGEFHGVFRLYRSGYVWEAFIWFIENTGYWREVLYQKWIDHEGVAAALATQVQVRLMQRASYPVVEQKVNDIQVFRLNDLSAGQVPILGNAGDIITFDHKNENIMKNGESIIRRKAFIGDYFKLKSGLNTIAVEPAEAIEGVKVRYHPKWR